MRYLAVIPARKGSKSLPNKNTYPLLETPLIYWTIKSALKSMLCDIVITTDSLELKELIKKQNYPVKIIDRPDYLCGDEVPLSPVIVHACRQSKEDYDAVITLQPTSPFRTDIDIIEATARFEMSKADSLISVCEDKHSVWQRLPTGEIQPVKERLLNRQYEQPLYIANGAIFITRWGNIFKYSNRICGKVEIYVMSQEHSIDIHTLDDIKLAEYYYEKIRGEL